MSTFFIPGRFGIILLCTAIFATAAPLASQEPLPDLKARVQDSTGTLTQEQISDIERLLAVYEKEKGTQIAVLMIPTTGEESIEQYSIRVAEQWKIGREGVDDGVILIVAKDDRKVRIEVGYGLEGVLTDFYSKRIITEIIVPLFKNGEYFEGILTGLDAIIKVVSKEELPLPEETEDSSDNFGTLLIVFLISGFIIQFILGKLIGLPLNSLVAFVVSWIFLGTASLAIIIALVVLFFPLFASLSKGGGRGGSFSSSGGGFSSGGSFGGGGFSGGGGGFGGGGASGSW